MEELPLMQEGVRRGVIRCQMDPVRTHFSVRCPDRGPGLYKVWLAGNGKRMLLGTLEPAGGFLVLERACSRGTLRAAGVEPPEWGELTVSWEGQSRQPPKGWGDRRAMPLTIKDRELRRALESSPPGWYQRKGSHWLLAWPWNAGEVLPAPSLACLGWADKVEGRSCFLLRLNEKGWPVAHKASGNWKS